MDFELLLKKIKGTLTKDEKHLFDAWFKESETHKEYFFKVEKNYQKDLGHINLEKAWERISQESFVKNRQRVYFRYSAAAAILLIFVVAFYYFQNSSEADIRSKITPTSVVVSDDEIKIGTDKAILELENGENVALVKGKEYVAKNIKSTGEKLTYTSSNNKLEISSQNILTVPRGGQFLLVLSDGTKVFLNSETKLRYPVAFADNATRKVELLYGEAYFEVTPSSEHNGNHFMVISRNQEIDVIGTEFNVKSYKEEFLIKTTLVEGQVRVGNKIESLVLKPNEQSQFDLKTNKIKVSQIDVYNEISWKRGVFSFKNTSLKQIMKVLSRWYDVDFEYQDDAKSETKFNGSFRKKQRIQEILSIIEKTNEATFNINGKKIIME